MQSIEQFCKQFPRMSLQPAKVNVIGPATQHNFDLWPPSHGGTSQSFSMQQHQPNAVLRIAIDQHSTSKLIRCQVAVGLFQPMQHHPELAAATAVLFATEEMVKLSVNHVTVPLPPAAIPPPGNWQSWSTKYASAP
jgi:hypothetical protein